VWPGVFQHFQSDAPEFKRFAVVKGVNAYSALAVAHQTDASANAIAQLKMSGNEIGVEMRQENIFDRELISCCKCDVLIRIALRINDDGRAVPSSPICRKRGRGREVELP